MSFLTTTTVVLAQAKPPSPSTSIANPFEGPVDELTNLGEVCKAEPSSVCTSVQDKTNNAWLAGFADWFVSKPLAILLVVLVAWLVNRITRRIVKRSMKKVVQSPPHRTVRWLRDKSPNVLLKTDQINLRSETRADTLGTVLAGIATAVIWLIAVCVILGILEVDFGPVLATAGIIGVAFGFGAQYMVRDFLAGTFLVIEDQFGVGDIVDLGGDASGTVEKLTLRSTRLRDVNGVVWHVPNGQIVRVGNKSQEWARAVLDLELAYDADIARAQDIIRHTAEAMSAEEDWQAVILETPEVWGVESFTANGITVRLVVKTQPASQFGVMRELRRRLKADLDAGGIPFGAERNELLVRVESEDGGAPEGTKA
jgi:small conductance mechanosensitive channel